MSFRPLEEEYLAVMSAPKRPAAESSITSQDTNSPRSSIKMPSLPFEGPAAVSETPLESVDDLYTGQADVLAEEPQSRKRKAVEGEIQLEELESIMSEDMDFLNDSPPNSPSHREKPKVQGSANQKLSSNSVESSIKKQRLHQEQTERTSQKPDLGLNKERSQQNLREQSVQCAASIKTEQVDLTVNSTPTQNSSKPPKTSASCATNDKKDFEDDDASFIEVKSVLL